MVMAATKLKMLAPGKKRYGKHRKYIKKQNLGTEYARVPEMSLCHCFSAQQTEQGNTCVYYSCIYNTYKAIYNEILLSYTKE